METKLGFMIVAPNGAMLRGVSPCLSPEAACAAARVWLKTNGRKMARVRFWKDYGAGHGWVTSAMADVTVRVNTVVL